MRLARMTWPYVGLALTAYGYGWFARSVTYGASEPIGIWTLILDVAGSPPLFGFVIVPAWLAAVWTLCGEWIVRQRQIRVGSRFSMLRMLVAHLARPLALGALAVVIGTVLAGAGLPVPAVPVANSNAARFFAQGIPPSVGLAAQVVLVSALLLALAAVIVTGHLVTAAWPVTITTGLTFFGWTATSAAGWVPSPLNVIASVDSPIVLSGGMPTVLLGLLTLAAAGVGLVVARDRIIRRAP